MSGIIEYRLFYASNDKESMNIYNIIIQNQLNRLFQDIDVIKLPMQELQNLSMKTVPTIVVSSQQTKPEIYDGPKNCSIFLNNLIVNRRTIQIQETESRMNVIQKAQRVARLQSEGPAEYCEAEMAGTSDGYAYMQTDMAQAKSFVLVGQEDNISVITPQCTESKIGKRQMSADISNLEKARTNDLNSYKSEMEQRQIDTIFSNGRL